MIMQVHDELVFDVLKSEVEDVKPIIRSGMSNVSRSLGMRVPLVVDMNTGSNRQEAH